LRAENDFEGVNLIRLFEKRMNPHEAHEGKEFTAFSGRVIGCAIGEIVIMESVSLFVHVILAGAAWGGGSLRKTIPTWWLRRAFSW
jgi:hypothetical protein